MPDPICQSILKLLADERAAIKDAQFAKLEGLLSQKERLFAALPSSTPTPSELKEIKQRLDTNQSLLNAAITGVADAQVRIAALRNVREGLSVYDQSGQIAQVQTRRKGFEKKA